MPVTLSPNLPTPSPSAGDRPCGKGSLRGGEEALGSGKPNSFFEAKLRARVRAFDPRDPALDGEEERGGAFRGFGAGGKVFAELEGTGDSEGERSGRSIGRSLRGRCLDVEISGGSTDVSDL